MSSWWLIASASKAELEPQGETPKLTLHGWTLLSLKLIDKICLQHWNKTKRVTENTILMLNSVCQNDLVQLCFCNEVTALIHTQTHSRQWGEDEGFCHRETSRVCFEVYCWRFIQLFLFTSVLRCLDCLPKTKNIFQRGQPYNPIRWYITWSIYVIS